MIRLWSILLLAAIGGCAHYEFNLTQPDESAQHIGRKEPTALVRAPVEYQFQAAEGRLVILVHNPTDSTIDFLGDQSYVVDPDGQSHPFPNMAIAPNSYIKLILPPMLPVYRAEPGYGVGVGVGIGAGGPYVPYAPNYLYSWPDPYYYREPLYFSLVNPDGDHYWSWNDQTSIRLRLAYRQNDNITPQDFEFQRVKVQGKSQ